jgi:casein kinase I homolog HRR25
LLGIGQHRDSINIIDFGLAMRYRDDRTHRHIPCTTNYPLIGTAAFASLNNHYGLEQSRRDDLESLAYVLLYFLRGSLPWYGAPNSTKKQRLKFTTNAKANSRTTRLFDSHPKEFTIFLDYTRALRYN